MMSIPEGAERNTGAENLFKELTAENFPNLGKELDIQVYEANRTPYYLNVKRSPLRLITLKLSKVSDKERILRAAKGGKIVTYESSPINFPVDL